jgi:hypothetical protein
MSNYTEDYKTVKYNNTAGIETYWYKNIVLVLDEDGDKLLDCKPHAKIFHEPLARVLSIPLIAQTEELKRLNKDGKIEHRSKEEFMVKYHKALKIIEKGF